MILFLITITILTAFFACCILFIQRKVVTNYRGGLMILLSGAYFTIFFGIAHILRDRFP
jgi:hypothetical protein